MRIICGTILAVVAVVTLSVHGAVDPLAGSPEGERVPYDPKGEK